MVDYNRSQKMSTAALILGIISIATCTCIYLSIPCGGMAVLLALLSRGGEMTLDTNAKLGILLGVLGIGVTIAMTAGAFAMVLNEYGSLENYLRAYCEQIGIDYEGRRA